MFRAKVLVGKFTQGSSDYRRPPEIPGESTFVTLVCILAFKEWIELGAPKLSPWLLVETGWCIYDVADGDDIP
jgi:hypothetical protein